MSLISEVTEAEAAAMIGWTPEALRAHRRHQQAEQVDIADAEEHGATDLLKQWTGPLVPGRERPDATLADCAEWLLERRLVAMVDGGLRLTRQGKLVGRILRGGVRSLGLPDPVEGPGPRRYLAVDVHRWLEQHPEHRDRDAILAATISDGAAADVMEIEPSTLRSARSKRTKALERIASGEGLRDDPSLADRCPEHVIAGFEIRYDLLTLEAWLLRKGRVARGSEAC